MDKENLKLADEIMDALIESRVWFEMCNTPALRRSREEFESLLEGLPWELADQIITANGRIENDIMTVAVLYGMRALLSLLEAIRDPAQLSQYILDRMKS